LPKCGRSEQQKRIEAESDLAVQAQEISLTFYSASAHPRFDAK
jgi:hypothetical protein